MTEYVVLKYFYQHQLTQNISQTQLDLFIFQKISSCDSWYSKEKIILIYQNRTNSFYQ